jgi:predicted acylesterase/phospholipase RssA
MTADGARHRHAVVLSGGGGYGAYEIGVMRALFCGDAASTGYRPVQPAIVTGTSVGALNAAMLCSAPPGADAVAALDFMEDVWLRAIPGDDCGNNVLRIRGNPLTLLDQDCRTNTRSTRELGRDAEYLTDQAAARATAFLDSTEALQQRLLDAFDASVFIAADRFASLVEETVDLENIRQSGRALRLAATNWRTGKVRVFSNHEMTDEAGFNIVRASTAIPGIFQTVEIDGEPYADGGIVMNTPLSPAIDAGAETIHAVYMDPTAASVPLPRIRNTASTLYRMAVIVFAAMMSRDIEIARRVNLGIDIVEGRESPDASGTHISSGYLLAARRHGGPPAKPYRKLAIHRYHPKQDPGGTLRWLNFDRDGILRMMDQGYADAATHDCSDRACLVVETT